MITSLRYDMDISLKLKKGQRVSLTKDDSDSLTKVFMGLGWSPVKKSLFSFLKKDIDLDASCVMLDRNRNVIDIVWFKQLHSKCNSVIHSGDNLTGEGGEGDKEVINVDLERVPRNVNSLVFTVSSFQGQSFNEIESAYCRLVNSLTSTEMYKYEITGGGDYTGMIMVSVYRRGSKWRMRAIGKKVDSTTVKDLIDPIVRLT